jgi:hypothetical protein
MKELIRIFNEHGVEYLLVGGFAFGVHAQPRATKDIDLFIRANADNSNAVFRALCKFGEPLHGLTAKDFRDAETGLQIDLPPNRIDILQQISGVTFDEAWYHHVDAMIEGDTPTYCGWRLSFARQYLRPLGVFDRGVAALHNLKWLPLCGFLLGVSVPCLAVSGPVAGLVWG